MNEYNKEKKYTYILATGTGLIICFYKDSTLKYYFRNCERPEWKMKLILHKQ